MSKKAFSAIEQNFIQLVNKTQSFTYEGVQYDVDGAWKPSPKGVHTGECKTDVFIKTKQDRAFKISIKKTNADFLENKMSYERALQIFGADADGILQNSTSLISAEFIEHPLICISKYKRTEEKTIMLGWKFELMNKRSGEKSGQLVLTDQQKINVYSGTNLEEQKKNALVDGEVINNSGVAEFILEIDDVTQPLQQYIDQLENINDYAPRQNIYFACKALNYRSIPNKWDGDRPLAVYVDWKLHNGKLTSEVKFQRPLQTKGNEIGNNVKDILNSLEITADNFHEISDYYDGKIHK